MIMASATTGSENTTGTIESSIASCTTAVPGQYGYLPPDACHAIYNFNPNFEGNLAFAILFGLTMTIHVVQAIVYRKASFLRSLSRILFDITNSILQRYCWVLIMGAAWECAAFVLRTLGAHDQQNQVYAIVSTLLIFLAPLCMPLDPILI
jgi:hypothetical protein